MQFSPLPRVEPRRGAWVRATAARVSQQRPVLYYIDTEDSSYAFYEEDLSNDQEQDDTLDKVPITGSGPTSGMACCIPF
ncbi:hypothetical protein E2562_020681 [Oryza meyeriana var. granulata]|uniref:Uncharacterized protein n=1 Tax=Oryza meyeriana var. granulata TaxID=110450 RepID=A0A6G1EB40_9ORYZ|nr:hypothetical protein E2562_020681 [Oryza meyeriana var. granulata]